MRACLGLFLVTLLWDAAPARAQSNPLDGLDEYVHKSMKQWKVPGLAMAIVKDDKVVLSKGYGIRTIGKPGKVDQDTMFAIASNTKAFTATALGLLVHEGKIKWDDKVTEYLPDFAMYDPHATSKMTIRDLLCHRAGLGRWAGDLTWYGSNYDTKEIIRRIRYQKPAFDFRTGYGYTNLMYLTAGQIIPVMTGQSWKQFIKQRFFDPLGMRRSNLSVKALAKMDNVATPHLTAKGKVTAIPYVDIDHCAPPGAINSCARDIAQWMRLQLADGKLDGKQIVDAAIIRETRKPHTLIPLDEKALKHIPSRHFANYGLGWGLSDYQGRLVMGHGGGLDGMFSYTGMLPEEKLGVMVMTNLEEHSLAPALAYHLFDAYLGVKHQDWSGKAFKLHQEHQAKTVEKEKAREKARLMGTRPTFSLNEYSGAYNSSVYGKALIKYKNGKLTLHLGAHPQINGVLKHWHNDTFLCDFQNEVFRESFIYFDLTDEPEIKQFRVKVRPDWLDTYEYTFVKE